MYLLSGPPSWFTASTKRSCSSGVHFNLGLASVESTSPGSAGIVPPCRSKCLSGGNVCLEDRKWLWLWSCCWWWYICNEDIAALRLGPTGRDFVSKPNSTHMTHLIPLQFCFVLISRCRLQNPDWNDSCSLWPFVFGELRGFYRTMELYSLGVCSNKLGLLMPGCYAETGFIRKASEERISNSWKKHSSLTQSLQQLKRGKRKSG